MKTKEKEMKKENIINPKVNIAPEVLLDEMMWPAARYCIGRHTYVSDYAMTYASIIVNNREAFSAARLQAFVRDIRANISQAVGFHQNVTVENAYNDRITMDAYSLIAGWLDNHDDCRFLDCNFEVDCYTQDVIVTPRDEAEKTGFDNELYDHDLEKWVTLANVIDESTHKIVTTVYEGKEQVQICVPVPMGTGIYNKAKHQNEGYVYLTVYKPLERVDSPVWIAPEYITNIDALI